jgi:hypothetical protein
MEAINCKACRIEIEETEANESLSVRARAHAETCLPCRAFRHERQALRQLVGSLETVAAPPDFDFRLRARLAATAGEGRRRFAWPGFAPGMSAMAVAASLALLIGAWVIFRQVNSTRQAATQPTGTVATVPANNAAPTPVGSAPASTPPVESPVEYVAKYDGDNSQRTLRALNRRGRSIDVFHEPKLNVEPVTAASTTNDTGIRSIDFGALRPAPQLYPTGISNPAVDPNPAIIVPIRALAQPAKFLFDDERGTALRTFSLRNVTFGSERLIENGEASGVGEQDASDIW